MPAVEYQEATIDSRLVVICLLAGSMSRYVSAPPHAAGVVGQDGHATSRVTCPLVGSVTAGPAPGASGAIGVVLPSSFTMESEATLGFSLGTYPAEKALKTACVTPLG